MRTVIELRRPPGSIPIEDIKPDAKSRDDTPALPVGVQAVYRDEALRNELFALLEKHILPDRRRDTGRPGMDLRAVLAVGVLKQGLRCDCDRLQDQADGHIKIRQMLGHGPAGRERMRDSEHPRRRGADDAGASAGGGPIDRPGGREAFKKSLARRWSGAAARSWRRRTSAIRPTSTCCGTRSAACFGRRRGPAAAPACPDGGSGSTAGALSKRCNAGRTNRRSGGPGRTTSGPICPPRAGSRTGRRLRLRRCGPAGSAPARLWTRSTAFLATQGGSPTGPTAACCKGRRFRTARRCSRSSRSTPGGSPRARPAGRPSSAFRAASSRTGTGSCSTTRSCGKAATPTWRCR